MKQPEPTKQQQPQTQGYNQLAYIYPPDQKKSNTHRLANRIFRKINFYKEQQSICDCCGRFVGQQSNADVLCYDPLAEFSYLGPGVPLLFVFVQNIIIYLFLLVGIVAIQGVVTNGTAGTCRKGECNYQSFFSKLSVSQKILDSGTIKIQLILTLVFTLVWIIVNQVFIYRCRSNEITADQKMCTPSDFAIFLLDLPDDTTREDIEDMLNHKKKAIERKLKSFHLSEKRRHFYEQVRQFHVQDIIIPLKLDDYIQKQIEEQERFKECVKKGTHSSFIRKSIEKPKLFTNFAIIVFQKEITKRLFLKNHGLLQQIKYFFSNWGLEQSHQKIKNQCFSVQRAAQPDDIIWQNLQNSHKTIIINKVKTFGLGALVLFAGALIEFGLSVWEIKNKTTGIHSFIVGLSSVLVSVVNYIISVFLVWATNQEGNITKSKYNASLNYKVCLFQFINSGLFYTLSNLLASIACQVNFRQNQQAFAQKITSFMLINAFYEPIQNVLLDYLQIPNSIYRFLMKHDMVRKTQKECNTLYQLKESRIPFKYSYIVKTIWLTCFYTPFVPVVSIISLLGLVLYYILIKISFRYFYKITEVRSNETNLSGLRLSYFAPFMLNFGRIMTVNLIINDYYQVSSSQKTILYISLAFSIIYGFFPWYQVNKQLFQMNNHSEMNYKEFKDHFEITYDNKMISNIQKQSGDKNQKFFFINEIRKYSNKEAGGFRPKLKDILSNINLQSLSSLPSSRNLLPKTS